MNTTVIIAVLLLVVAGILVYGFFKKKKAPDEATAQPDETLLSDVREDAIVALNLEARKVGVSHDTNVEAIIDKCIEVHESLLKHPESAQLQVNTLTGDFKRLIDIHLPEFITTFQKLNPEQRSAQKGNFDQVVTQLIAEMEEIIANLNTKNYSAFSTKTKFMEIRYSDQY